MANITKDGLHACMNFAVASIAVAEVAELARDQVPDGPARELLVELEAAHRRLRAQFDQGEDSAAHALALSVLLLADRTTGAMREDCARPGS